MGYCFLMNLLVVMTLAGQSSPALIQSMVVDLDTPETHNGKSAVYVGQTFNLSVTLTFDGTAFDDQLLTINLGLPGVSSNGATCSKSGTYLNGTSYSNGCTSSPTFVEYTTATKDVVTYDVMPGVIDDVTNNKILQLTPISLAVEFGSVNVTTTGQSASSYGVKVHLRNISLTDEAYQNETFYFTASALLHNSTNGALEEQNVTSNFLYKIGPQLQVQVTSSSSDVQSGDPLTFQATIGHHSHSTEAAQATISFELDDSTHVNSISGSYSGRLTGSLTSIFQTIAVSSWTTSETSLSVSFTMDANDDLALNSGVELVVTVIYKGTGSYAMSKTAKGRTTVYTKQVTFTSGNGQDNFPDVLGVGDVVTLAKVISLPLGSLYLAAYADFQSSSLNTNPIEFVRSSMTPSSSSLLTDPSLLIVTNAGFMTSRRRRRALNSRVQRNFGKITNPAQGGVPGAQVSLDFTFGVRPANGGGPLNVKTGFLVAGQSLTWNDLTATINDPNLQITKTIEVIDTFALPNRVRINTSVTSTGIASSTAYDVTLKDGSSIWAVFWGDNRIGPAIGQSGFNIVGDTEWTWTQSSVGNSQSMFMSVEAKPSSTDGVTNLPGGTTNYTAFVAYYTSASRARSVTKTAQICVKRVDVTQDSIFYNYGFTVLMLLVGLILGALIVIIVFLIIIKVCRKYPFAGAVEPYSAMNEKVREAATGYGLVTGTRAAQQFSKNSKWNDNNTMGDICSVDVGDSIVQVIGMEKNKADNELDNLDIAQSSKVDASIETERNKSLINATKTLLSNMNKNGDVSSSSVEKVMTKFKRALNDLDKRLDATYQDDVAKLYEEISRKNQAKLEALLAKQEQRREEMEEMTRGLPQQEAEEVKRMAAQEEHAEKEELNKLLRLQQEEKMEELRKEYSVRKRLGTEEAQDAVLQDITETEKLSTEQSEWMMNEYMKNVVQVKKIYNEEMSRQKMVLNEKLERRRMLASRKEIQEAGNEQVLDAMEKQQIDAVAKMKKQGAIDRQEAEELIAEAKRAMADTKKKLEMQKQNQLDDLQRKFNDRKKKRLQEQAKKQKEEVDTLDKKQTSLQSAQYIDPLALIEERQHLLSAQMAEINALENEIDNQQTNEYLEELEKLNQQSVDEAEGNKKNAFKKFVDRGLDENDLQKILKKHDKDMARFQEERDSERERQEQNLKEKLEKRRKEWNDQKEKEIQEQNLIREQEEAMVRKLMDNQVAISEEERDKVMKEHEKHMVKLEANLTLNRIQQKRMLEEKLAKRRAQKMEMLQKDQAKETKLASKKADQDSDMDDEDKNDKEMDLLRRQAEERMQVLKGDGPDRQEELDQIQGEMIKERENALSEQGVRLGAMLANLQMEKAKEMARIEEQQKAIHELKSNLMDDLNEKGILSDPECQRVIEIHQAEQEKLTEKLESQREKQEKKLRKRLGLKLKERERSLIERQMEELSDITEDEALRKRLAARMKQKEEQIHRMHQEQQDDMLQAATPAAKLRLLSLKAKHQKELQDFRNRIEKEISQTLEEMRRKNDIRRLEVVQEQELQFINGLVRLGKFEPDELENVIVMLFPNKTENERKEMMEKLCEGYEPDKEGNVSGVGELESRVRNIIYGQRLASHVRKRTKSKRKKSTIGYEDPLSSGVRPEPLGRSGTPDIEEPYKRIPQSRLPPLETVGETKRKKKKKKKAVEEEYYEY